MVLRVLETQGLTDGALPVEPLAMHMRLGDGYAAVPGQEDRLRLRLRAAIRDVERRLGFVLIERQVVLGGAGGATRIAIPLRPVISLELVQEIGAGDPDALAGATLDEDADGPFLSLPGSPTAESRLRVVIRAGYGDWADVPAEIEQAVLSWAEALDMGVPEPDEVPRLLAPWRRRRLGGRV